MSFLALLLLLPVSFSLLSQISLSSCQECAEQEQSDLEWSRVTLEWKGVDNKSGTTLVLACVLCLDLLLHM